MRCTLREADLLIWGNEITAAVLTNKAHEGETYLEYIMGERWGRNPRL